MDFQTRAGCLRTESWAVWQQSLRYPRRFLAGTTRMQFVLLWTMQTCVTRSSAGFPRSLAVPAEPPNRLLGKVATGFRPRQRRVRSQHDPVDYHKHHQRYHELDAGHRGGDHPRLNYGGVRINGRIDSWTIRSMFASITADAIGSATVLGNVTDSAWSILGSSSGRLSFLAVNGTFFEELGLRIPDRLREAQCSSPRPRRRRGPASTS